MTNETWDETRDALLIERTKEKVSATKIAAELADAGFFVTRSAVLGRIHRLRKAGKMEVPAHVPMAADTRRIRLLPLRPFGARPERDGCRFIEGEPAGVATVFCDAPKPLAALPYCAAHMLICYRRKDEEAGPKRQVVAVIDRGWRGEPKKGVAA